MCRNTGLQPYKCTMIIQFQTLMKYKYYTVLLQYIMTNRQMSPPDTILYDLTTHYYWFNSNFLTNQKVDTLSDQSIKVCLAFL